MSPTAKSDRIYSLDLLRSIAIVAVVLFHFPRPESAIIFRAVSHYGLWGVDLFFILSGYLIGGQWFRSLQKGNMNLAPFYLRRFLRTLPAYYIFLGTAVVTGWIYKQPLPSWQFLFFVQNFAPMTFMTHTWSLCVEEHFYFIFPIFGLAIWHRPRLAKLLFILLIFIPLAIRTAMWTWLRPDITMAIDIEKTFFDFHTFIYYPTAMRFDTLVVGVALSYVQTLHTSTWTRWLAQSHQWLGLSLVFLGAAAVIGLWKFSFLGCTFEFTLIALGFGALLVSALGTNSLLTQIKIPLVHTIALWSYSIYLTHLMAMALSEHLGKSLGLIAHKAPLIALHVFMIAVTAGLMHFTVEKPFLRWRDRILKKPLLSELYLRFHSQRTLPNKELDHPRKVR